MMPWYHVQMNSKQNRPEKHKPWAIIKVKEPRYPQYVNVIKPPITIPIWATEEYAIKDFKSVWRIQIPFCLILGKTAG